VALAEEVVRRRTGLVFPETRRDVLAGAIARGVERSGAPDLDSYLARVEAEPELLDDLVAEITVGETYFCRDPEQLAVIRDEVLPSLLRVRPGGPLRIWSAGCASGEEAYTLAILLDQRGLLPLASIVGTDLARGALALARRARYRRWSFRGVSPDVVAKYFEPRGNAFEVVPELRRSVDFRYLNLAVDEYPSLATGTSGMDLIVCRNVLMYFDAEAIARAAERLVASLSPDGWLVTGASDPPLGDLVSCEVVVTGAGLAYRRSGRPVGRAEAVTRGQPIQAPVATALSTRQAHRLPEEATPGSTAHSARREQERTLGQEMERAVSAYETRDYVEAAEAAARLTGHAGAETSAWVILVRSHANQGALAAAGRACAEGLERHPTSAELAYLHGVLLLESGRASDAVAALNRARYLDRGLAVTHLALAGALAKSGDTARARQALRNAERLLSRMPRDARVPAADGELAGRLLEAARAQLSLLSEEGV
jgi:chemotaxis protein methyltransferase CheR